MDQTFAIAWLHTVVSARQNKAQRYIALLLCLRLCFSHPQVTYGAISSICFCLFGWARDRCFPSQREDKPSKDSNHCFLYKSFFFLSVWHCAIKIMREGLHVINKRQMFLYRSDCLWCLFFFLLSLSYFWLLPSLYEMLPYTQNYSHHITLVRDKLVLHWIDRLGHRLWKITMFW